MDVASPVDRIRRAFQERAGGSVEQALLSLLTFVVVAGARIARLGTLSARAAIGAAIVSVVVWQVLVGVGRRREAKSARDTLRRVLSATDPVAGDRALRALTLVERTSKDDTAGSPELAELHLRRLLDRVSSDAVRAAGGKYAQKYRGAAIALVSLATLGVFLGPAEVVEGLDVLVARAGRAPLTMSWLSYPRLVAQPPSYTRESERSLVFGTSVALPKGTVLTVRGIAESADRALVLTDGAREERFTSDGAGGLVARYVVRSNAVLRVAARFGDVRIDDEDTLEVSVVPDAPPTVEVENTPRTVRLADAERIEFRWTAHDDHGLREVDLVLRSGPREDRRVLGRYDGENRTESGGHVLSPRDAFLRRMFLPVTITVEAKDNDPFDGPKWSTSAPVVVIPPDVGAPEAERYAAIVKIRDRLVDLLKWVGGAQSDADRRRDGPSRLGEFRNAVLDALGQSYSGASIPRGFQAFVRLQLDHLGTGAAPKLGAVEDATLAVDVALRSLGNRDAAEVSKRLGDVAEEAAVSARVARDAEHGKDGERRLDDAIAVLERGAAHLVTLSALGRDVGSVAIGDLGRIRRSRDLRDFTHTELAALHLAGRLRRPAPSFGATTGHGGGRSGVESGRGKGGGEGMPSPSSADEDFDETESEVAELAREHKNALSGVESALEEAAQADATDAERDQAKKLADRIRDAAEPLPLPGEEFGTPRAAAALAREHATAAARALENLSLPEASESAESASGAIDQAEKQLDQDDPLRQNFAPLRSAIRQAREWAESKIAERRSAAEARARSSLEQAGDVERELGDKAAKLSEKKPGKDGAALPHDLAEGLERASSIMREASKELASGKGEQGLSLQREAQRLLEQARSGRSDEESRDEPSDDKPSDHKPSSDHDHDDGGKSVAIGGDVPGPDGRAQAEEFRKRVLEGLGKDASDRLSPAVRRYAEGLLR